MSGPRALPRRVRVASACAVAAAAFAACHARSHDAASATGSAATAGSAARTSSDGSAAQAGSATSSDAWPELAAFTRVVPDRVIALPARPGVPRFDVGGPAVLGGIAAVASSQFGFLGVDYASGTIAWSKPAGLHVAPPLAYAEGFYLLGDCIAPPVVPAGRTLLGCLRAITPTGADRGVMAIHGATAAVAAFADEMGVQRTWLTDAGIAWRRGDQVVLVDPMAGVAVPAPLAEPPLVITHGNRTWSIAHAGDGRIVATEHGKPAWHTDRAYTTLLGAVYMPEQTPMVRVSNASRFRGDPELSLIDIDAMGSLNGQVAFPVPGIALVGHAIDSVGDVALAVQLAIDRDYIAGYAANALLMWVYPLPVQPRADPIGVAVTPDAVLVFHDGDTLTVLPELSAPPAAPGAARPPSEPAIP